MKQVSVNCDTEYNMIFNFIHLHKCTLYTWTMKNDFTYICKFFISGMLRLVFKTIYWIIWTWRQQYSYTSIVHLYNTKIWQEYLYTSIVQYSYIFLYDYCGQYSYTSIVVAKFKWSYIFKLENIFTICWWPCL
jgi:hypothetical protein